MIEGWKGRGRAGVEGSGFFISREPVAARRLFLRSDATHEKIASRCLQLPSPLNPLTHSPFRCSIAPHLQAIYPSFNPHCPNFAVHSADIQLLLHTLTTPSSTYSRLCSRPTLSTSLAHRFTKEQVSRLQTPPPPPAPRSPSNLSSYVPTAASRCRTRRWSTHPTRPRPAAETHEQAPPHRHTSTEMSERLKPLRPAG